MTLLSEYNLLKDEVERGQARMAQIASDPAFLVEREFEERLRALLGEYSKSLVDVIAIVDPSRLPSSRNQTLGQPRTRKARELKTYRNPHTGEVVQTKGGNNAVLKAWKAEYGHDAVNGWVES